MKAVISPELAAAMFQEYANGGSLYSLQADYGFKPTTIWHAFKRYGYKMRTPKQAGPIQGAKRSGDNHWLRKSPKAAKTGTYRSRRIVDEDGLSHKRRVHVILMEQHIGRRLQRNEVVHHINGNKHDNRIDNLQLMTRSDHAVMEMKLVRRMRPEKFIREIDPTTGRFLKQRNR